MVDSEDPPEAPLKRLREFAVVRQPASIESPVDEALKGGSVADVRDTDVPRIPETRTGSQNRQSACTHLIGSTGGNLSPRSELVTV